ncbi:MAG: N-acetylmuramoyl-L-alanine amidase [Myxococcales bacterium]|nr:N-acetylmuramoyl-L-alanine amidase [Myxococcales bacterium]
MVRHWKGARRLASFVRGLLCLALVGGLVGSFAGLAQADAGGRGRFVHSELGEVVWYAHRVEMDRAFVKQSSPILSQSQGFTRLGLRWDARPSLAWEVRFRSQGQTWSPWYPLSVTWKAEIGQGISMMNGHFDPPSGLAQEAQIRFLGKEYPHFVAVQLIRQVGPAAPHSQSALPISLLPGQALTGPFNARSVWGAAPPKCTTSNPTKNRIAIHHTVTPNNETGSTVITRLRGIQNYHQNTQGWCDIGYHLLVSWDGFAWEGTQAEYLGTNVGGQNTGTLGISFLGDFTGTEPPSAMTCTGSKLIDWGVKTFGVPRARSNILGHQEFPSQSTSCPGARLLAQVSNMIQMSSSSTCSAPPPPNCDYIEISAATLNIRPQPNTSQAPVGTVSQGTCLKVLKKDTNGQDVSGNKTWYQITYNNVTGWVSAFYAPCSNCGPPPTPEGTIKGLVYDDAKADKSLVLKGVAIKLNSGETATTDASGNFSLKIKPGTYTVTASLAGYTSGTAQAKVEDGKTVSIEIALKKAVTADTTPPTITIESPLDGATLLFGNIDVTGKATDNVKVDRVEVNGMTATLAADGSYSLALSLGAGSHTITAVAFDAAGNKGEAKVQVTLTGGEPSGEPTGEIVSEPTTQPDGSVLPEPAKEGRLVLEPLPETTSADKGQGQTPCKLNSECSSGQLCQGGRCTDVNGVSGGCGCQSSGSQMPFFGVFLLLLLALRPRRRQV